MRHLRRPLGLKAMHRLLPPPVGLRDPLVLAQMLHPGIQHEGLQKPAVLRGVFEWGLFEDAAQDGRFLETFMLDSWMEHLRQHERVTEADRRRQEAVHRFQTEGSPKVTHLIASDRSAG